MKFLHGEGSIFIYIEFAEYWKKPVVINLIKSPQYTGGDFMFLYRFVRRRRRRRRPQILVHENFWTTFWISFIFGTIVGPDL